MVDLQAVGVPRVGTLRQQWRIVRLLNMLLWGLITVGLWTALDVLVDVWRRKQRGAAVQTSASLASNSGPGMSEPKLIEGPVGQRQ